MNVILVGAECAPWSKTGMPSWLIRPPSMAASQGVTVVVGCVWHPHEILLRA